jgi:hypothetical protein
MPVRLPYFSSPAADDEHDATPPLRALAPLEVLRLLRRGLDDVSRRIEPDAF